MGAPIVPPDFHPPGYGPTQVSHVPAPRKLLHEDSINRQVQLVTYLRSVGHPFSEAVMALRSLCIGLEDDAFNQAWEEWPCNGRLLATRGDGTKLYAWEPTPEQAAQAFNLIMALLSRWGMTFTRKTVSRTPAVPPKTVLDPALMQTIQDAEAGGAEP